MKHIKYHQKLGSTTACTKRITEAKNKIGQEYRKGAMKDFYFWKLVLLKEFSRSCNGSWCGID